MADQDPIYNIDTRFDQYWIRSTDGEVVDYLIGYSAKLVRSFRWDGAQNLWVELSTSLPEMEGLGGSTDYTRVTRGFAERYLSRQPTQRSIPIADV